MNRFYLEQMKLGELDEKRAENLKKTPGWEKELEALEESDAEILSRYPADKITAKIREKQAGDKLPEKNVVSFKANPKWGLPLLSVAAALILFAVSIPFLVSRYQSRADIGSGIETTRIKGGEKSKVPLLHIYRNTGTAAEELKDSDTATAGDRLQIGYYTPVRLYGAIFSLDGRETLTRHWPEKGSEMAALEHGREILLPWAYELDNAPRYETFMLIYSRQPLSFSVLSEVIRSQKEPSKIEAQLISLYGKNAGIGVYSVKVAKR